MEESGDIFTVFYENIIRPIFGPTQEEIDVRSTETVRANIITLENMKETLGTDIVKVGLDIKRVQRSIDTHRDNYDTKGVRVGVREKFGLEKRRDILQTNKETVCDLITQMETALKTSTINKTMMSTTDSVMQLSTICDKERISATMNNWKTSMNEIQSQNKMLNDLSRTDNLVIQREEEDPLIEETVKNIMSLASVEIDEKLPTPKNPVQNSVVHNGPVNLHGEVGQFLSTKNKI